jgi:glycerol uptake operon antiterminator
MQRFSTERCFKSPVIPVCWNPCEHVTLLSAASSVILQGGLLAELHEVVDQFHVPTLEHLALFVHIDLVAGLENNEAGLEYLSRLERVDGIVTVHHHLARHAKQIGLLSIIRLFLSDTRAVERGLSIASKSRPDILEILPAAVAGSVAKDFASCPIPRIAGGLCRTEEDVRKVLASGCRAVSGTSRQLWKLNQSMNIGAH